MLSSETEAECVAWPAELGGGEMKRNAFSKLIPVVCEPGVEESWKSNTMSKVICIRHPAITNQTPFIVPSDGKNTKYHLIFHPRVTEEIFLAK